MPEPSDHADTRNALEELLRRIPGFRGYLEKEYRRETDALERTWLADRLQRAKQAIDEVTRRLADAGQIDDLPPFDRFRGRLDKLIFRIRGAMQGYSGVFDLVRIDEAVLDRVYDSDLALTDAVQSLAEAIEALPGKADAAALLELTRRLDEIERAWNGRDDILKGLA